MGAGVLRLSGAVTRLHILHAEREAEAIKRHNNVIYALWHGRLWLAAARYPRRGIGVLVSLSEDGDLMARVLEKVRLVPVRGSSSRGGEEGFRELERWLSSGHSVAITPDGPRGPRHTAAMGAVVLAAKTGKPIVPLGVAAAGAWTLRSWDAFQIPKPGTRGVIAMGEPFVVPLLPDLEPWRRRLEIALNEVESEADREAEG
jgi:hypothetical protein